MVERPGHHQISMIPDALNPDRFAFCLTDRGQEQRGQNSDDRDHNQQFHKGKSLSETFGLHDP